MRAPKKTKTSGVYTFTEYSLTLDCNGVRDEYRINIDHNVSATSAGLRDLRGVACVSAAC